MTQLARHLPYAGFSPRDVMSIALCFRYNVLSRPANDICHKYDISYAANFADADTLMFPESSNWVLATAQPLGERQCYFPFGPRRRLGLPSTVAIAFLQYRLLEPRHPYAGIVVARVCVLYGVSGVILYVARAYHRS